MNVDRIIEMLVSKSIDDIDFAFELIENCDRDEIIHINQWYGQTIKVVTNSKGLQLYNDLLYRKLKQNGDRY